MPSNSWLSQAGYHSFASEEYGMLFFSLLDVLRPFVAGKGARAETKRALSYQACPLVMHV
jgi:hypothetical protein